MIKVFNVVFTVGRNAEAIIFLNEMKKQVSFIFVYFITYLNHKIDDKLNYLKITKCTKTCTHVIQFFLPDLVQFCCTYFLLHVLPNLSKII